MSTVLFAKIMIASTVWTIAWLGYMLRIAADPNTRNMIIVFAPWIIMFVYAMFFWWP